MDIVKRKEDAKEGEKMAGSNYRETWFENNKSNHGWYTCVRCGKKLRKGDVDIDHIIPQNWGGKNNLNNLQCMCKHCNRSKQDKVGLNTITDYTRNVTQNKVKDIKKSMEKMFSR